jgi:hypothetical protein
MWTDQQCIDDRGRTLRQRILFISFSVLICVLNFLPLLPYWDRGFIYHNFSESIYHAREVALGQVPYRDYYSHHLFGYLVPFIVSEILASPSANWYLLANGFANLLCTLLIAILARNIMRAPGIGYAAALCSCTIGWLPAWTGTLFDLQSSLAPLVILLVLSSIKCIKTGSTNWLVLSSFAAGTLIICDQRALAYSLVLLVPVAMGNIRWTRGLCIKSAAAYFLPAVFFFVYLSSNNALTDFIEQTFFFPLQYRNSGFGSPLFDRVVSLLGYAWQTDPIACALGLGGLICIYRQTEDVRIRLVLLLYLVAGASIMAAGGRVFANYLLVFGPLICLGASALLGELRANSLNGRAVGALTALLIIISTIRPFVSSGPASPLFYTWHWSSLRAAGHYVAERTSQDDDILVWGYFPQVYLEARRFTHYRDMGLLSIASGEFHFSPASGDNVVPRMLEEFRNYLVESPPRFIVYPLFLRPACDPHQERCLIQPSNFKRSPHLEFFRTFVAEHYSRQTVLSGEGLDVEVYALRGEP